MITDEAVFRLQFGAPLKVLFDLGIGENTTRILKNFTNFIFAKFPILFDLKHFYQFLLPIMASKIRVFLALII